MSGLSVEVTTVVESVGLVEIGLFVSFISGRTVEDAGVSETVGFVVGVGDREDGCELLWVVGLTVAETEGTTGRVVTAGDVDG